MTKLANALLVGLLMASLILAGCNKTKPAEETKLTVEKAQELSTQGKDLVKSGKFEEANKALEQVAKSQQGDAKTYIALGISRYQKQDLKGALEAYDKAIALDATAVEAYQGKANVYRDQKNLQEAEQWYRKAFAVNPRFTDAYSELAIQLRLAGRLTDAIPVLKDGVDKNLGDISLMLLLADFYKANKQVDEAKTAYAAVLKIDGQNKTVQDALSALK